MTAMLDPPAKCFPTTFNVHAKFGQPSIVGFFDMGGKGTGRMPAIMYAIAADFAVARPANGCVAVPVFGSGLDGSTTDPSANSMAVDMFVHLLECKPQPFDSLVSELVIVRMA